MIVLQVGNYSVGFPPNEKWVSQHCFTLHQPARKIPKVFGEELALVNTVLNLRVP